ncbi:MAG TPA: MFS transporter [Herpetosiphonaceae bacterium]|nr:MFS transporter [Herpetosiphonaceae bacterium]
MESASSRRLPFAALRHRDFRLLWGGQVVSIAGSQMQVVALHVQFYRLAQQIPGANPALYLGLIGLMQLLPLLILGLGAGVLADRFDRRSVMLVTQSLMMGFSVALAALTWLDMISLPVLYVIVALTFATRTFDTPSRQALVPALVPRETLPNALSLNMIAWQFGHIVGPALGGLLVAETSIALIYGLDALSFGAVLLSLLLMRHRHTPPPPTRGSPATAVRGSVLEGLRFVWGSPIILSTMLLDFVATFFGAAMTLLPLFADQILRVDARGLGLMYAAPAVGALGAALVMSTLGQVRNQGKTVLVSVVIYGLATAVFGVSRWLPLTLLALAGTGAADTVSAVLRGTIRQIATPDQLRGRATSVNMIFFQGGPLLGEFEAGLAATLLGAPLAVGLGGLACVLATLVIAWRVPTLRRHDI